MASLDSGTKTLIMGVVSFFAIILAIVVAVKTFSDGTDEIKPPTEKISGTWQRSATAEEIPPPPGAPAEYLVAQNVESFDAANAESGSVDLVLKDGKTIKAKVLTSEAGHLLLQVPIKGNKVTQVTIAQMGDGKPVVVTDGLTTIQFDRK